MKIKVHKEDAAGERRVAIVPESVKRLAAKKIAVTMADGAGVGSFFSDDDYRAAGAVADDNAAVAEHIHLQIRPPSLAQAQQLAENSTLISLLYPLSNLELVKALAARRITAVAVDMIPRTTVAQMMDVLSSQATVAGYEAVLIAAAALPRFFPMLMTAAGTIAPARALVLGAGVAGLTAIGTARRLGAVVEAFDVRKVVKEQVESLGAKFVNVESEDAQSAGGYAKELGEEAKRKQAEAIAEHVRKADVVICTAQIPGRPAPLLVSEDMVKSMRAGSVIVDLAAEAAVPGGAVARPGNCALTRAGETVVAHGVTIIGANDTTSRLCAHASQMYSRNMEKLLLHFSKDGVWNLNFADEIISGCVITHAGEIVHARVKEAAL